MKIISTKLMLIMFVMGGFSQPVWAQDTAKISVKVTDIHNLSGDIKVGLYNNKANYKQSVGFRGVDTKANKDTVQVSFENLPAGEYGIRLFHDIDSDGEFGMNKYGIPTEPYAYSNNAKGLMGPAKWKKVKFVVAEGSVVSQTISLK